MQAMMREKVANRPEPRVTSAATTSMCAGLRLMGTPMMAAQM
jgi:hypothetical protein